MPDYAEMSIAELEAAKTALYAQERSIREEKLAIEAVLDEKREVRRRQWAQIVEATNAAQSAEVEGATAEAFGDAETP